MAELRIATFNLENFDETRPSERPSLAERIQPHAAADRPAARRHRLLPGGQRPGTPGPAAGPAGPAELLAGTNLAAADPGQHRTVDGDGVYDERNMVVATTLPVLARQQLRNDLVAALRLPAAHRHPARHRRGPDRHRTTHPACAARPARPGALHVINVHLKSKIPTDIPGQKIDGFTWRSADAWAEGSSSPR